jgi:hypothetical protein
MTLDAGNHPDRIWLMSTQMRIQKQYRAVLAGLALGLATGLAGLFWLDSRALLLGGMAVIAATIVVGEKTIRCPACGHSVYVDIAREAAFSPSGIPGICPRCQGDWSRSAADGAQSAVEREQPDSGHPKDIP